MVIHLFIPVDIFFGIVDSAIYSFVILESKDLQSLLDLQKPCEPHRIRSDLNVGLLLSLIFRNITCGISHERFSLFPDVRRWSTGLKALVDIPAPGKRR